MIVVGVAQMADDRAFQDSVFFSDIVEFLSVLSARSKLAGYQRKSWYSEPIVRKSCVRTALPSQSGK